MVPHFIDHIPGGWWMVFGPLHFLALVAVFVAVRSLGVLKGQPAQRPATIMALCVNAVLVSGAVGALLVLMMNYDAILGR